MEQILAALGLGGCPWSHIHASQNRGVEGWLVGGLKDHRMGLTWLLVVLKKWIGQPKMDVH